MGYVTYLYISIIRQYKNSQIMKHLTLDDAKQYRPLSSSDMRYNMRRAIAYTLTPIQDDPGWEEITYYGASWIDPTNTPQHPHYIYILVNPSIPGICKIGFTTTTVYDRVKQINSATGVITPWYPVFSYKCPNGRMLEQEIHEELALMGMRVNDKREGFAIDSDSARAVIEKLGKKYKLNEIN
jgi:hypothetical protein